MRQSIDQHPSPAATRPHLSYRADIDGLRAFAVLAVVLYHFGMPGLGGGFSGVDVFFVISGFLIGGLLWQELQGSGTVNLPRFWLRRIRRLAPAFFAMALVTTLAGLVVLLPFGLREYGKSLVAATVWLSNVEFWRETGYFDAGRDTKPLLHTWSLAVEEQFYLFLPVLMLLLARWHRAILPVLALLTAASLLASLWVITRSPESGFYLFPFRAWEMLGGVVLAIVLAGRGPVARPWLALAGLGLVIASAVLIRPQGFPGWQALVPVVGALMVLANTAGAGPGALVLRAPPTVFIGLISYSLYLWHWPVLILSRYFRSEYSGLPELLLWLALAFVLAVLSWAFVERPVRRGVLSGRHLATGFAGAVGLFVATGLVLWKADGLAMRFGPETRGYIAASQDFLQDWSRCTTPDDGPLAGIETCAIGPEGPPRVLIWGDSHLRAQMDGLALAAVESGTPGLIIWHAGCPPLFGVTKVESASSPAEDAACLAATETFRHALPQMTGIERILIIARWSYYAEGTGIGLDAHNTISLAAAPGAPYQAETQMGLYAEAFDATMAEIALSIPQVYVLRQVPEIPDYDSRQIARALAHGAIDPVTLSVRLIAPSEVLAARVMEAEAPLHAAAAEGRIHLIDPWPLLCPERCSALIDGVPVYFDNNHMTNRGAMTIRALFFPFFTGNDPTGSDG